MVTAAATRCPGCRRAMSAMELGRKPHGALTVDLCGGCQALWFDTFESLQLTPGGTLDLFRAIHATHRDAAQSASPPFECPRCMTVLAETQDIQHTTRFSYHRCRYGHGRFTPFLQFMREKNFVRPLAPRERERLAQTLKTVRCSSCGAPVDLEKSTTCGYCRSPLMVLDPDTVERTLASLDAAEKRRVAPDADRRGDAIIALAEMERDMARARVEQRAGLGADLARGADLIELGFTALGRILQWR